MSEYINFLGIHSWGPQTWAAIFSAAAAWLALALSIFNLRTSRLALHISEAQETRRKPSITSYLQDAYVAVGAKPNARVYAVLVSLSNKSDSDNGIAWAGLYLTYAKKGGAQFTIKVDSEIEARNIFSQKIAKNLQIPFRIDAHQTISGWMFFTVEDAILKSSYIEATRFVFSDTHGNETSVEPLNVREYRSVLQAPPTNEDVSDNKGTTGSDSG